MARVAVTTTLSGATAGCFGVLIKKNLPKAMGGTGVFDVRERQSCTPRHVTT